MIQGKYYEIKSNNSADMQLHILASGEDSFIFCRKCADTSQGVSTFRRAKTILIYATIEQIKSSVTQIMLTTVLVECLLAATIALAQRTKAIATPKKASIEQTKACIYSVLSCICAVFTTKRKNVARKCKIEATKIFFIATEKRTVATKSFLVAIGEAIVAIVFIIVAKKITIVTSIQKIIASIEQKQGISFRIEASSLLSDEDYSHTIASFGGIVAFVRPIVSCVLLPYRSFWQILVSISKIEASILLFKASICRVETFFTTPLWENGCQNLYLENKSIYYKSLNKNIV